MVTEVCKRAEIFRPVRSLFPDEEKVHYLAVFDKENMDDVLLMYHLLYTNTSRELFGGYSLYDYPLVWYQTHLQEDGTVLRSPFLPDQLARFQGNLPFCFNPVKTVYVRRNIAHMLESGYFFLRAGVLSLSHEGDHAALSSGGTRTLPSMRRRTAIARTGGWRGRGSGRI